MTINKARWFRNIATVLVVLAGSYAWLFLESHAPDAPAFLVDLPAARRLARSIAGAKPSEIRVEQVAQFSFPQGMIMAGEPWSIVKGPDCSYQVVYPDKTVIIDTGMDEATGKKSGGLGSTFDRAAFARVSKAMVDASAIVVTHEHLDHLGGLVVHPSLAQVLQHTLLNREQVDHPEKMKPLEWPNGALNGYQPFGYENGLHAIASGMVLIASPGHTPGSQMVFVERGDGAEFLFIGDVAWQMRNIEQVRERPRFVTMAIGENRGQVWAELAGLHAVMEDPRLQIVPGHDGVVIDGLIRAKLLVAGFK